MNILLNRKRFWLVVALLCLLEVVAIGIVRLWGNIFTSGEVSELYTRYSDTEGLYVSYAEDLRLGDNISVDVTLIEAMSDSAWAVLQGDFGLPVIPIEYESLFYRDSAVVIKYIPKGHPELPPDSVVLNNDLAAIQFSRHIISVFKIENEEQRVAIFKHEIRRNYKKKYHEKND